MLEKIRQINSSFTLFLLPDLWDSLTVFSGEGGFSKHEFHHFVHSVSGEGILNSVLSFGAERF